MFQEHQTHPGPLPPRPLQRRGGPGGLLVSAGVTPDGRRPGPGCREGIPAPVAGPDGGRLIAVAGHHLAQQDHAAEVEPFGIHRAVFGSAVEAIRFRRDDVERLRGANFVEALEVAVVGEVVGTGFHRRGQRRGDDDGVFVGGADGRRRCGQQRGIVEGVDRPVPPMRPQVGFIPDDVGVDLLTKARGEGARPGRKCPRIVRRGKPSAWIPVQQRDQGQPRVLNRVDDALCSRPVKIRLEVEALFDRTHAQITNCPQRSPPLSVIVLGQVDVEPQPRPALENGPGHPFRQPAQLNRALLAQRAGDQQRRSGQCQQDDREAASPRW